jgi:hypothetical protein
MLEKKTHIMILISFLKLKAFMILNFFNSFIFIKSTKVLASFKNSHLFAEASILSRFMHNV